MSENKQCWNHRLVLKKFETGYESLGIHEVYYEDGKPTMVTENAQEVVTFNDLEAPYTQEKLIGDLRWQLEQMLKALDNPILDYEKDFPKDEEETL